MAANRQRGVKPALFDRLAGLETEYAVGFCGAAGAGATSAASTGGSEDVCEFGESPAPVAGTQPPFGSVEAESFVPDFSDSQDASREPAVPLFPGSGEALGGRPQPEWSGANNGTVSTGAIPHRQVQTPLELYRRLIGVLGRQMPLAEAQHLKEGVFLPTGGAVWYEMQSFRSGLIEGSTPECRGPRQLVAYQRAQDRLLANAVSQSSHGACRLLKNDRDAWDHVYGAQENYEATLSQGLGLAVWRTGMVVLLPFAALAWLSIPLNLLLLCLYLLLAGVAYLLATRLGARPQRLASFLFGAELSGHVSPGPPLIAVMDRLTRWITMGLSGPLAIGLALLTWAIAFRHQRRALLPFLVSRPIIAGSGHVGRDGTFLLADKATAINSVTALGGFLGRRPIFLTGQFFKAFFESPRDFPDLLAARQRMQIGLGDSNMSEAAEFLRVGTTMLVLDAIESGCLSPPRLKRPIAALHAICADPALNCEVAAEDGQRYTALELQRLYLEGCRQFLQQTAADLDPRRLEEAWQVIHLWENVLERLVEYKQRGAVPPQLLGSLDWLTKKHLLEAAGRDLTWSERKKIDLRYHELSEQGYFQLLTLTGCASRVASDAEVERAMRVAPEDSPATMRGRFIREFASDESPITANWKRIRITQDGRVRNIRLAGYRRR